MDYMDRVFHKELSEAFSFKKVSARFITKKLKQSGIVLSEEELQKLENALENIDEEVSTFTLDDFLPEHDIEIDMAEKEADELLEEVSEQVKNIAIGVTRSIAKEMLKHLDADASRMLTEHQGIRMMFENNLKQKWGKAFNILEQLIVVAFEAGEEFNKEFPPVHGTDDYYVLDALTRLHARACQIAYEVLTLLRAGFADGAHARWRTIHEIAVVASFIKENGADTAERYLLHHQIESYKATLQHQRYSSRIRHKPIPPNEVSRLKGVYDKLLVRYGQDYRNSYGWASSAIGKRDPSFADIEEAVGLDHWRPYYKMASHNVHANPKGIMFRLGSESTSLLLAGPSNKGFTDPAHGTAISLTQITTSLLLSKSNIDRLVIVQVLLRLTDRVGNIFLKAHLGKLNKLARRRRQRIRFHQNKSSDI